MAYIELNDKHLGWILLIVGSVIIVTGAKFTSADTAFLGGLIGACLIFFGFMFLNKEYGIIAFK